MQLFLDNPEFLIPTKGQRAHESLFLYVSLHELITSVVKVISYLVSFQRTIQRVTWSLSAEDDLEPFLETQAFG